LVVTLYPFYYNTLTTDVEFYKNYSFEINYTVSNVAITDLSANKPEYELGETVTTHLGIENAGVAQDVVVSALVRRYGTAEVVDGLLLETLSDLGGAAAFTPQWNSSGAGPGLYYVEVTLKDAGGDILDRQTEMFRLGIAAGKIASFTVTPESFDPGDSVSVSLVFSNTGTLPITGTAVVRVLDGTGETVQEFQHNVNDLAPGLTTSLDDVWDTSGLAGGTYNAVGFVAYDSTSTDPMTATVNAAGASPASNIYLPLVLRDT
jgi:hypothetical protein